MMRKSDMSLTIDEIKKDWNSDAIYDITGIKEHEIWEYYFSWLFSGLEFTVCWIGGLTKIEGKLSSRAGSRLLFMKRTEERFRTFRLYWDMFTFHFQDGKINMFMGGSVSGKTREMVEEQHLSGKDWIETVYERHEKKDDACEGCGIKGRCPAESNKNEVVVTFVARTFEELNLVTAREFTQEEMNAIDNAVTQKEIEKKQAEIEDLRAGIK